jgi:hypothetical protein
LVPIDEELGQSRLRWIAEISEKWQPAISFKFSAAPMDVGYSVTILRSMIQTWQHSRKRALGKQVRNLPKEAFQLYQLEIRYFLPVPGRRVRAGGRHSPLKIHPR